MLRNPVETLHSLMTNQLFILAVAIVLFFLAITLMDPGTSEAVLFDWWV
jgi:hypothetical protein